MDEYESLSHSQCSVAEIREQSLASFWKIESAVAVQAKGRELRLYCCTNSSMRRISSRTLRKLSLRMACCVIRPNHRSTWLSQEE